MTNYINITTREQFEDLLHLLKIADERVIDTETNGLRWYKDHQLISLSVYFPEYEVVFNAAFRHGQGTIDIDYNETNNDAVLFENMSWQGKAKKQLYLSYWFNSYAKNQVDNFFGNLPISWMDELKKNWSKGTHIYHNAQFDLHILHKEGFPPPEKVIDTLVMLHIVNEDWQGIEVEAPYRWTDSDRKKGLCQKKAVGRWAVDGDGTLMKKTQRGNRELKWQAAFVEIENATDGEEYLYKAIDYLEDRITDHAFYHLDNPYNDSLVYKTQEKRRSHDQWERLREKISLDDKANLWMLPSESVAYYAMLDVVLTWKLYQHWLPTIKAWNNEPLFEQQCQLMLLAWQMESNGVLLDVDAAKEEIKRIDPLIAEVQDALNKVAENFGYKNVNIGSPKQLLDFLNWENEDDKTILEVEVGEDALPANYRNDERISGLMYYNYARPSSTSHDVLSNFDGHPVVMLILEWRKLKKSSDTYLKNWLVARDENGYVHAGMNSTGTVAGRWSSSGDSGNFQNIPDRNGYQVKRALITLPEWIFIGLDYGQLEARLASWYAEDMLVREGVHNLEPTMIKLFNDGVDLHAYTRDMVGVREIVFPNMSAREIVHYLGYTSSDEDERIVGATCRFIAKTLNFGLLYNGTEYMASHLLKLDLETAKQLVDKWKALFPAFSIAQKYYEKLALTWRKNPTETGMGLYVTQYISGRHRKLHKYPKWLWYYEDNVRKGFNPQEASAKKVWNNLVQGLGGYICTVSGVNILKVFGNKQVKFFANIHDALDGYIHRDSLELVKPMMQIMTAWPTNPILTVDLAASIDGTWQGMKSVKDVDLWINSAGREGF